MISHELLSVVDVDVLALRFDREINQVVLGLTRRRTEPFLGELALPGVVLMSGERLTTAARRALTRLQGSPPPIALGQIRTFDEPMRDPRGPALSIAMWAVYSPETRFEHETTFTDLPPLGFDHAAIIGTCQPHVASLLWRNLSFSRGLTGDQFSATQAAGLSESLTGLTPHRANLNRTLSGIDTLMPIDTTTAIGRGRPAKIWAWQGEMQ